MSDPAGHLVDPRTVETLDVLGPTVQILTPPGDDEGSPCLMRGTIPPGGYVPLHSHREPETFIAISGRLEGLTDRHGRLTWVPVGPGEVFHVPSAAKHAWRNPFAEPAVNFIVTTEAIARFFREIGTPIKPGHTGADPTSTPAEAIEQLLAAAARHGHWVAAPEENAAIGLPMPHGRGVGAIEPQFRACERGTSRR